MDKVGELLVSVGAPIAFLMFWGVVFSLLPENWLQRWRGVLAAGALSAFAAVVIAVGVAALVRDDHLGAATPKDAYVMGPFAIVLGLAILGFAVAAYRNFPLRQSR